MTKHFLKVGPWVQLDFSDNLVVNVHKKPETVNDNKIWNLMMALEW